MIDVAIVGLGWWGRTIAELLRGSSEMRAVVGVDPESTGRAAAEAAGLRTSSQLDDVLGDPTIDAVVLCSPHRFHVEQVIAAAAAGKHVFCEKPFSTNAADAERAVAAVTAAGLQLGIGHERRFEPAVVELTRRVRDGDLGVPLAFEGNFSQDKFLALPPDNWRLSATEAPVGPLSATGIHLVDLAISMFGQPDEVRAHLATRATTFANGDTLSVTMTFPSGATAVITAILTTPFLGRVCVLGSEGWMEIRDRRHPEDPRGWDVSVLRRGESEPQSRFFEPSPAVLTNLEAFAGAVAGRADYPVTPEEILANVRTFEAITRSALSGQAVRVQG